jgi:hypothetical protein
VEWHCQVITVESNYVKLLSVSLRRILHMLPDEAPAVMAEDIAGCKRNSYTEECSSTCGRVYGILNVATGVTNLEVLTVLHVVVVRIFESRNSFGVNYGSQIPAYCNISSYVITTS